MKKENLKKNSNGKDKEFKKFDKPTNKFVKFKRNAQTKCDIVAKDKHDSNDPAFYKRYAALAENAARIAFNHRNGAKTYFSFGSTVVSQNIDPLMVLQYVPTPGRCIGKTAGLNMAADAAYKVLNRKYRGSPANRYQSADFGISQFAIMDFYLSLAQAERAYGLCQVARVNQVQVPRQLVMALGFDYDEISSNLANFRAKLNALIVRAQVLCLVKGYSFMDHHLFLMSNVFKDKDTERANYFMYSKPGYWLWVPTEFATGSALKWVTNRCTKTFYNSNMGNYYPLQTSDDCITNLDAQLTALLGDSDIDAICADVLALFDNQGDANLLKLQFLPDGYIVTPIFAEEALLQLHNTVVNSALPAANSKPNRLDAIDLNKRYGTPYPTSIVASGDSPTNHTGLFVYQIDGTIQFDIQTAYGSVTQIIDGTSTAYGATVSTRIDVIAPLIDTNVLNPSVDDILEMTRQVTVSDQISVSSGGSTYYITKYGTFGTAFIAGIQLHQFGDPGNYTVDSAGDYNYISWDMTQLRSVSNGAGAPAVMKFDWHPFSYGSSNVYGDLDNYRSVELPILQPIHEAAGLSEFHNPISDILIKDI